MFRWQSAHFAIPEKMLTKPLFGKLRLETERLRTASYKASLMSALATWCMFAQVFPLFQVDGIFATLPVLYKYTGATTGMELSHFTLEQMNAAGAYPVAQGVMSILAVVANVICIAVIIKRAIEQKKNPYKNEIFAGTKDFEEAMDRA